ncbi:hypothetical protein ACEPAF_7709 [Sanghuangporus sanghuang]
MKAHNLKTLQQHNNRTQQGTTRSKTMFHPGTEEADKAALVDFRSGKKLKCLDVHLVPGPSLLWLRAYGPPSRPRVGSELLTLDPDAVASAS